MLYSIFFLSFSNLEFFRCFLYVMNMFNILWKNAWKYYLWGNSGDFIWYWDFMKYVNHDKVEIQKVYETVAAF